MSGVCVCASVCKTLFLCPSLNMKSCVNNVPVSNLYKLYPFQHHSLEWATFGSSSTPDMWAVPARHRLTSRQVAEMATCRDLSTLALRHAPAECLCGHGSHTTRQQKDVRDGKKVRAWPSAPTIREHTWGKGFLRRVRRQSRAARYSPGQNVQYDHTLCISHQIHL